jgi:hypothetical protein
MIILNRTSDEKSEVFVCDLLGIEKYTPEKIKTRLPKG